jgi:molybdopterin converting factor subunit 1
MQLQLLYFARLRERFGSAGETLQLPAGIETVGDLIAYLASRGEAWAEELSGSRVFRVAMNQELVELNAALHEGAEIAIFPPVTGG